MKLLKGIYFFFPSKKEFIMIYWNVIQVFVFFKFYFAHSLLIVSINNS